MIAVIDIGTNTFHLLIAQITDVNDFEVVFRKSQFVRIAQDGIDPISEAAIQRAIDCLLDFKSIIDEYKPLRLKVLATEGFRSSSNATELIERIFQETGFKIEVISGKEEAELIFLGTIHAIPKLYEPYLIMDIGGGSVEFIIGRDQELLWSTSYKLGVQYLFHAFEMDDPIENNQLKKLYDYLDSQLHGLENKIRELNPKFLVGASGSFETISSLDHQSLDYHKYSIVSISAFDLIYRSIIESTLAERLINPEIPKDRAELIVIGVILVRYIVDLLRPKDIIVSEYALREGVLFYRN